MRCSSETSVDFHPTTCRYIPEYRTLQTAVRTSDPAVYMISVFRVSYIRFVIVSKYGKVSQAIPHLLRNTEIRYFVEKRLSMNHILSPLYVTQVRTFSFKSTLILSSHLIVSLPVSVINFRSRRTIYVSRETGYETRTLSKQLHFFKNVAIHDP
jgi:hypothetical protein